MWEAGLLTYLAAHDLVTVALIGLIGATITQSAAIAKIIDDRRIRAEERAQRKAEAANLSQSENLTAQAMQDAITQHALNEALLEAMNVAFVLTDADLSIIRWNDAACALLGWSEHEMTGRAVSVIIPPAFRAAHLAGFDRYKQTGEGAALGQTLLLEALHKNGRTLPVYLSLFTFEVLPNEQRFFCALLVPREAGVPAPRKREPKAV